MIRSANGAESSAASAGDDGPVAGDGDASGNGRRPRFHVLLSVPLFSGEVYRDHGHSLERKHSEEKKDSQRERERERGGVIERLVNSSLWTEI